MVVIRIALRPHIRAARVQSRSENMGNEELTSLERELFRSYTENISFSKDPENPHMKDVLEMVGDRILSLSLRKQISAA